MIEIMKYIFNPECAYWGITIWILILSHGISEIGKRKSDE